MLEIKHGIALSLKVAAGQPCTGDMAGATGIADRTSRRQAQRARAQLSGCTAHQRVYYCLSAAGVLFHPLQCRCLLRAFDCGRGAAVSDERGSFRADEYRQHAYFLGRSRPGAPVDSAFAHALPMRDFEIGWPPQMVTVIVEERQPALIWQQSGVVPGSMCRDM